MKFQCSLNESLLSDPFHVLFINSYIKYLTHNSTPDISPISLWETQKVVVCGDIIKLTAGLKKCRKEMLTRLEKAFYWPLNCLSIYSSSKGTIPTQCWPAD